MAANSSPRKLLAHMVDSTQLNMSSNTEQIRTVTTDLLKINHPIMLAGMNVAAGPKLAAAVSNAGGIGVIGGVGYTPDMLREQIAELKGFLKDDKAPFGVDLLLPQVGGSARKTKYVVRRLRMQEMVIWLDKMLMRDIATTTPRASSMSWSTSSLTPEHASLSLPSVSHQSPLSRSSTRLVFSTCEHFPMRHHRHLVLTSLLGT